LGDKTTGCYAVFITSGSATIDIPIAIDSLTLRTGGTVTLPTGGSFSGSGPLLMAGGTLNLNSAAQFGDFQGTAGAIALASASPLTIGNDGINTTYSGTLSGSGALIKIGTGSLTLGGTNTSWGANMTLSSGTLVLGNTKALGFGSNDFYCSTATISAIVPCTMSNFTRLNGTPTFNITSAPITWTGIIADFDSAHTGSIIKTGSGTLTLNPSFSTTALNSTWTGGTIITGGILEQANDGALGAVPPTLNPAALAINGGTWRDATTYQGNHVIIPATRGVFIGPAGGTLDFSNGDTANGDIPHVAAPISGPGTLTKIGYRSVLIDSDNSATFTGDWIIKQGRVNVQTDGSVNALGAGTIYLTPGTNDIGQFGIGNSNVNVSAELDNNIVMAPTGNGVVSFEINGPFNSDNNSLTLAGVISGAVPLMKGGGSARGIQGGIPLHTDGALVLRGTNAYTGGTLVNFGSLVVANPHALGTGPLSISGTASTILSPGLSSAVQLSGLTLITGAKLDVNNNALVLTYGAGTDPVGSLHTLLKNGYNAGAWNGPGILSSSAAADGSKVTGVGYGEAGDLGFIGNSNFKNTAINGKADLIRYTYNGDSNLDGKVDLGNDFNLFLQGFVNPGVIDDTNRWVLGDYNYDNVTNSTDFALFIDGYAASQAGRPLGNLVDAIEFSPLLSTAQKASLLSVIPEPSALLLCAAMGAAWLMTRRGSNARRLASCEKLLRLPACSSSTCRI
jgi:fibronectin-binding autotransporter adhesin